MKGFPSLFAAILDDDRVKAQKLIASEPASIKNSASEEDRYESGIGHWIYSGDTLLHVAAAGYRVEIAKLLLAAGADATAAENRRASQPLHYAADGHPGCPEWNPERQVAMIHLLLKARADVNSQDKNGATPLHRAVRTRSAAAVKYLLEAGANSKIKNKPGSTPFHLAVQNTGRGGSGSDEARTAQREILEAFLKQGVSPSLQDAKGQSVLDWARSDWIRQILLRQAD